MSRLFINLYQFFQTRRILLFTAVFLFIGAGVWCAFNLDYEEDITRVMPTNDKAKEFTRVLEQIRFTDKIILSISTANPEKDPSDKLVAAGEELAAGLEELKPELLSEITFKPEDDKILEAFDLFYQNLPLFLDSADYVALDSAISQERVQKTMASGYHTLLSPAGSFLKKTFLRDPLSLTPRALRRLQSLKVDNRFKIEKDVIFSADGQQLMMYLQPTNSAKKTGPNAKLAEQLANLKTSIEAKHGVKVYYFGAPLVAAGNATRIKTDINIIMSAVGIFLFLFLLFFYRNPFYYFILIIPAAIGAASGFLMLYFLKGTASAIAMGVGGMVLGITIDYSLHVFTHFRSVKNIKVLLDDITGGMLLSSFTTVCTFYCLLFTNSEALRDLGIFAGTGVFTAAVASLIILPHLLRAPKNEAAEVKVNWIEKLTGYAYHKNPFIIGLGIVFSIVCVVFFSSPQFEGDPEKFSYMPPELAESEAALNKGSDVSQKAVFFITTGKTAEEALARAEANEGKIQQLKKEGIISSVSGPGELLFSLEKQQNKINRWNAFWNKERKDKAQQYIETSAKELGFKAGAFHQFFNTINKEYTPQPVSSFEDLRTGFLAEYITQNDSGFTSVSILKAKEEDKPKVYAAIGEQQGVFMFDKKKMATDLIEIIQVDLDVLVSISSIIVFIILLLSYGRIELATLTYIPLILSWVWTLGFMGILGMKFNIVNIIICTFVFGLGNDYCIFIMNGLMQDYRSGTHNLKSYKTSVFLSAFTTMLGVGAMVLSGHPALKSIAIMGVAGIGTVLFLSYAILPWLFHLLVTAKTNRGMQPLTLSNAMATLWAWLTVLWGFLHLIPIGLSVSVCFFIPRKYRTRFVRILLMWWAKFYIFVVFFGRKKVYNTGHEAFTKAGILVANHQSFIDVVYLFSLSPRITLTANNRIYNNPIFGPVSRMAGFLDVSQGIETMTEKIALLLKEGNIIAVFPEGTRSTDYRIHRFHKGAFKVAEETQAEIIPLTIYGTGDFLKKGEFWGRRSDLHVEILPRVLPSNSSYGVTYAERTKSIVRLMRGSYENLKENKAGTRFHRDRLRQNFLYLDPVLEWYCRIKIKFENYYSEFHKNLPKKGKIYDLGCGYGFLSYMLSFMSDEREIVGCDYDEEKIITANHRFSKTQMIRFEQTDLTQFAPENCDGIVISDVLHYLLPEQRIGLLQRCVSKLNIGGVLLVKDADTSDEKHEKTVQTETWSTRIVRFNKTQNVLHFFSSEELATFASENGLQMEVISKSKTTSNTIWKFMKKK